MLVIAENFTNLIDRTTAPRRTAYTSTGCYPVPLHPSTGSAGPTARNNRATPCCQGAYMPLCCRCDKPPGPRMSVPASDD